MTDGRRQPADNGRPTAGASGASRGASADGGCPRLAYLIGQYPAVNHTFILREIRQLRAAGFDIHAASILPSDRPAERLTEEEREELALTTYVKPSNPLRAVGPHLRTLF